MWPSRTLKLVCVDILPSTETSIMKNNLCLLVFICMYVSFIRIATISKLKWQNCMCGCWKPIKSYVELFVVRSERFDNAIAHFMCITRKGAMWGNCIWAVKERPHYKCWTNDTTNLLCTASGWHCKNSFSLLPQHDKLPKKNLSSCLLFWRLNWNRKKQTHDIIYLEFEEWRNFLYYHY